MISGASPPQKTKIPYLYSMDYRTPSPLPLFSWLLILILGMSSCESGSPSKSKETSQWVSLFNGQNLEGWTPRITGYPVGENVDSTFRVENGILQVRYDQYDNFEDRFGALHYEKPFSNYRLRVEYRFVGDTVAGAPLWGYRDSGIQYHAQSPKTMDATQPFPISLEFNLHGGNGVDERPVGQICANGILVDIDGKQAFSYCSSPTLSRTIHGDEWATMDIDVKGDTISHWINGEKILEFTNPRLNPDHGLAATMIKDNITDVTSGYISLQSNSAPVDFRKIEIKEYK